MSWQRELFERFRRELPFLILMWVVVVPCIVVWSHLRGEPIEDPVGLVVAMAILALGTTPLLWLRWERPIVGGERGRLRSLAAVGVGCLWFLAVLLVGLVALALVDSSNSAVTPHNEAGSP